MNTLDHFRYIVDLEATRLVATTQRTGELFVRKALADTIERLNERLRELGGTPIPAVRTSSSVLRRVPPPVRLSAPSSAEAAPQATTAASEMNATDVALTELVALVARELGLNELGVVSDSREQRFAYGRQMCMYLAWHIFGSSGPRIARFFRKRDHTTVMYGRDRIQNDLDVGKIDPVLWAGLIGRVKAIGAKYHLCRYSDDGSRAPNDIPTLLGQSA